jgi:hypothetical protein
VQNGSSPSFTLASGALPPGVTLNSTGQLTGIPNKAGVYSFVVRVTDPAALDVNGNFAIQVDAPSLSLGPQTLPGARANQPYEQRLTVYGGYAPYMYAVVAGTLPKGMTLEADGLLSGTPDVAAGNYTFTVRATDQYNLTTSLELVLTVLAPRMQIDTAKLPAGVKGKPYAEEIVASGASEPYSFRVSGGKLPPGLVLDPDGTLHGRPTLAGLFGFTVQAIDANGVTRLHYYGVKITQPAAPKKKTAKKR